MHSTIDSQQKEIEEMKVKLRDNNFILGQIKRRVESRLKTEAIRAWESKSADERYKTSLFGLIKSEKVNERDRFIEDYVDQKFDQVYKSELEIYKNSNG